jgi:hypothetical protein
MISVFGLIVSMHRGSTAFYHLTNRSNGESVMTMQWFDACCSTDVCLAVVNQQPNLMPAPAAVAGTPVGLEYLTMIDQLLVHQQVELWEGNQPAICRCVLYVDTWAIFVSAKHEGILLVIINGQLLCWSVAGIDISNVTSLIRRDTVARNFLMDESPCRRSGLWWISRTIVWRTCSHFPLTVNGPRLPI